MADEPDQPAEEVKLSKPSQDDWRVDSVKGFQPEQPRGGKWWRYPLLILLILGLGGGVYWYIGRDSAPSGPTQQANQTTAETQLSWPTQPKELIYAYKEHEQTVVRALNLTNGKKIDVFEFEERLDVGDDGELGASVALTPDGKSLAYVDEEGLKIYNLAEDISRNLITRGNPRSISTPDWSHEFRDNEPLVQDLLAPMWSLGGQYLAVTRLHADATSFSLHQAVNGDETDLGDASTATTEDQDLEYKVSLVPGREELKSTRLLPEYYLDYRGGELCGTAWSPDTKLIAACLVPNLSDAGSVNTDPKAERDLLLINTEDLSIEKLAKDYFGGSLAFSTDGQKLYATAHEDTITGKDTIRTFDLASQTGNKASGSLPVKDGFSTPGDIKTVTLYFFDKAYAVVESFDNTGHHAVVLDIAAQDQIVDLWVDDESSFKLLGVR